VKKVDVQTTRKDKERKEKPKKDQTKKEDKIEERPRVARMDEGLTGDELQQKVRELTRSRGKKKNEDAKQVVLRQLEGLAKGAVSFGPVLEIQVSLSVIRARFDNQRIIDSFMDLQSWRACYRYLYRIMTLLELIYETTNQSDVEILAPTTNDDTVSTRHSALCVLTCLGVIEQMVESETTKSSAEAIIASFTIRLKDEYVKALQGTNPGTHEYEQRRYDEGLLVKLAEKVQAYYVRKNDMTTAAVVALMQIEHTYYMHDSRATLTRRTQAFLETWGEFKYLHPACNSVHAQNVRVFDVSTMHPASVLGKPTFEATEVEGFVEPTRRLQELCTFVYKHGDEKSEVKHRALLMHVFYLAHHDEFCKARDMFLMSHLQDGIDKAAPVTQILYNRTLTQLGLSAFKLGDIQKAFDCLHPLYTRIGSGFSNVKKLLGQGFSNRHDRDAEQERLERRRQVPSHMQMVMDLVDSVYMTSTLLLELPYVARGAYHQLNNQRFIKMLEKRVGRQKGTPDMLDRLGSGPPENTQDHVIAGAAALLKGDWQRCRQYVVNLPAWSFYSGQGTADRVRSMLEEKIKCEGLRTYMLRFSQHYDSVSLQQLCDMFELDERMVKKVVSKMVFAKELSAGWANPPTSLVLFKTEPSPLQDASVTFAERAAHMVESNERLMDARAGGYGYKVRLNNTTTLTSLCNDTQTDIMSLNSECRQHKCG
jgi:translation initiation factor 3 subunit C